LYAACSTFASFLQKALRLLGQQVADGRTGEIGDPPPERARQLDRTREVAHHRGDLQPGKLVHQARRREPQGRLRDVDRHVVRGPQAPDEQARLHARATAELDQLAAAAGEARDVLEMGARQRQLGARRVVLGLAADRLEQRATPGVVKVLRRERLLRARQPRENVIQEMRLGEVFEAPADRMRGPQPQLLRSRASTVLLSSHLRILFASPIRE
jgi:hypothetical protein